jgi:magnesium transporter
VEAIRRLLASKRFELLDPVVVIDRQEKYIGAADLRDVMSAPPDATLGSIAQTGWPTVLPQADQEHAVEAAAKAGVAVLPVVDENGRVAGCIPAETLMSVLGREHREDLHRIAGILRERSNAMHALEDPPFASLVRRLPWLVAGLILSSFAAIVMMSFERTLQANIMIAFFIPSLVYITNAIGTQTEAIAVRALSLEQKPLPGLLLNEIVTGALIGVVLGILAMCAVWLFYGDIWLAIGVALSLLFAGTLASAIGLLFPWSLARLNVDPAFGAGPVGTIVQDVLTILVYFLVMTILLGVKS